MRLLFLTPQLPHPPKQGTAIRNWGLIKSLSARHEITLLSFDDTNNISDELRETCREVHTVPLPHRTTLNRLRDLFLSPLPDLAHRLASPQFSTRLQSLIINHQFAAFFIEGLELAPYLISNLQSPISIFDAHNAETLLQRRAYENDIRNIKRLPVALYSLIQTRRLTDFEAKVCRKVNHVTCVSQEDAEALRALVPTLNPIIVPNGIFLSDYTSNFQLRTSNFQLVFTGKMDYRPNIDAVVWFANEIFPKIKNEIPEAQFIIVGQKPTQAVKSLKSINGIKVTGAVDDIRPHIGGATVYVAPLRMGGGTRFKLLEAMALKKPIVSTTIGAEGFAIQNGREMLIADDADSFAQATITLLRDETKRQALSDEGYEFVKGYDWGEIVPTIEKILASV
ncbi:MAG: glycosyltransferase [Chloroflexi bacterium]|nr:glycosyltransferase [Chloroflexota bacterium]